MASIKNLSVGGTSYSINAYVADSANSVAWSNVTGKPSTYTPATHSHETVTGVYTSNGGAQLPEYIGANTTRFNMMNSFKNSSGTAIASFSSYADVILMNNYSWSDVPYATAIAVQKVDGVPRAWIAAGPKTGWSGATELITANNISSYANKYTHPTYTAKSSGLYKITVDSTGHVSAATAVTTTASNPTLAWGSTSTIGVMGDTTFKVTMPSNPNTNYTTGIVAGGSGATSNASTSNPYVAVKDNSTYRSQIRLVGGGATSISSDASGNITITSENTHPSVTNSAPTLSWGATSTIGTIGGTALTVKMPSNPNVNTTYNAGTGLSLSGTTFALASYTTASTVSPTASTLAHGDSFVVPKISVDAYGRASVSSVTMTLPTTSNTAHTHAAGTGISLSGLGGTSGTTTISLASGVCTAATVGPTSGTTTAPGYAGTFVVPNITVDTYGRVTSLGTATIKMPSSQTVNQVYRYTTTSTMYLAGSTSSSTTTGTMNITSRAYINSSGSLVATNIPATGLVWQSF